MKRTFLMLLLTSAAISQAPHQHHPPRSAEDYARRLNDPRRAEWQKPDEVVEALGLKSGETVADIGAGTGYFARRFAPHVRKVYAVDLDERLLKMAADGAPPNLETVVAAPDDPRLPDKSVDTIFFCDVLHHIDNRAAYYAKLDRALKPGGRIVMIDFHKRDLPVGPPVTMKLSDQQVVDELEAAGFRKVQEFDILPYQYFLVFQRRL